MWTRISPVATRFLHGICSLAGIGRIRGHAWTVETVELGGRSVLGNGRKRSRRVIDEAHATVIAIAIIGTCRATRSYAERLSVMTRQ